VTVQVAAIYSVGLRDMTQYVERFAQQQPNAAVHIEYLHPNRVYEKVLDGTADLGLVSFPRRSRELEAVPWREEEMVLVCSPNHPLAAHKAVGPEQLTGEKFVGFDKELTIRRKVDRFLREHAVTVDVVLEFDNIENIKKAVEISAGIALLPRPSLEREIEAGTLAACSLGNGRFVRPLGIILRRSPTLSATARRFIELLRQPDEPAGRDEPVNDRHARANGAARSKNGAARRTQKKLSSS
jgi:DNA-binding transcriptional LysR family regulator